jgi:hypothetical protein
MASLHITEYTRLSSVRPGGSAPVAEEPGTDQIVSYTTSTQSTAFAADTRFVRLIADAKAHIVFGANPTATANSKYITADTPEYFGVNPGDEVAAYDGTS